MNIRDVVLQEQKQQKGTDAYHAGLSGTRINTASQQAMKRSVEKVSARWRNMEVPVTPNSDYNDQVTKVYTDQQEDEAKLVSDAGQTKETVGQNLAVLTGEDYQALSQEEGSALEKYQESSLERAVERIRTERKWKRDRQEENLEFRRQMQEDLESMQAGGFLSQKSDAQIREMLAQADLPVTTQNVNQVVNGLQMYTQIGSVSDAAMHYIIDGGYTPSIANIYQGMYSGANGVPADEVSESEWTEYADQVQTLLQELGQTDAGSLEQAKWLFANELPITENNMTVLDVLQNMRTELPLEQVAADIVQTMAYGQRGVDTIPGSDTARQAEQLADRVSELDPANIVMQMERNGQAQDMDQVTLEQALAVQESGQDQGALEQAHTVQQQGTLDPMATVRKTGQDVSFSGSETEQGTYLQENETIDRQSIEQITLYRRLEEIRLRMTSSSIMKMWQQGIQVETQPLADLVDRLRQMEAVYFQSQGAQNGTPVEADQITLMQDTVSAVREIAQAPAVVLAGSMRQHALMTVQELHSVAISATRSAWQYQQDYEAVSTQVRPDLGDNIRKAWDSIPDLLQELGLEDTEANRRAVRILGYNRMEITLDNVQTMRSWDAQVNQMIRQMKPSVVLDMIRQGNNPLEQTVEQLNEQLDQQADQEAKEQQNFSKYLWQLEKSDQITEQERSGYIGIFRLLHQIEQSDGAAIGAVLQSGRQMTLANLLTAVRTEKGNGIDQRVDDTSDLKQSVESAGSITRQIETAFYKEQAFQVWDQATPEKIQTLTDGHPEEMLQYTLDATADAMQEMQGDEVLEKEYYAEQAKELRDTFADADKAAEFLANNDLTDHYEHIQAAATYMEQGSLWKDMYRGGRRFAESTDQWDAAFDGQPDDWESQEDLQAKLEQNDAYLEQVLTKYEQTADITYSDMVESARLRGLVQLHRSLAANEKYEIPMQAGDSVVCMNLTVRRTGDHAGRVQVSIDEPMQISMELRIKEGEVKGLILCGDRAGYERLQDMQESLQTSLESLGCEVKNLSYGMDFKRADFWQKNEADASETDGRILYAAAKVLVAQVVDTVKASDTDR